jgi:hypothetical protein
MNGHAFMIGALWVGATCTGVCGKGASTSTAQSMASHAGEQPDARVWVINAARVDESTLTGALKRVALIFRDAGIRLTWLNCPGTAIPSAACAGGFGDEPDVLVLRIVGYPAGESVSPNALGFAVAHRGDSKYASVFRGRVLAMVGRGGPCSEAELLGHAMAHELGHLLLGTSAHSRYGLMAARWRATDLDRAAVGGLLFSPAVAAIMRAEAVRRWDKSRVAPLTNLSERSF